jgi:hypothetical protein
VVHAQLAFPFCFRSVCLHIRFSHALNVLFFLLQRLVLHCSTLTSNLCCVVLSSILGSQFWCRVSVHRFDMGKRNVKSLKFNPFPDPKKGTGRKVLKRPAKKKNNGWKSIPYVRTKGAIKEQRMDQTAWKRKLKDFLSASDAGLIKLLRADRLLHDWTGSTCPRCQKGKLSKLQTSNWRLWDAEAQVQWIWLSSLHQSTSPTSSLRGCKRFKPYISSNPICSLVLALESSSQCYHSSHLAHQPQGH